MVWFEPSARILIAGQAPGLRVHETGTPFLDRSGDRLRDWMGVDPEVFDRVNGRAGRATHSFNFGVEGMGALGSIAALDRLRHDPRAIAILLGWLERERHRAGV